MSDNLFDVTMVELPTILPALPFSGSFLFPGTKLNLRIYEMRYIRLVFNALASSRMVGVIQPKGQDGPLKTPDLYHVGCAGRISGFAEADNVLLITLTGVSRFNVVREIEHANLTYRNVEVDFKPFSADLALKKFKFDKRRLYAALDRYAYSNNLDFDSTGLKQIPDEQVLMTLASLLPFSAAEKEALLEAVAPDKFFETLVLLLEMNASATNN